VDLSKVNRGYLETGLCGREVKDKWKNAHNSKSIEQTNANRRFGIRHGSGCDVGF
jgi:hypothetical protein